MGLGDTTYRSLGPTADYSTGGGNCTTIGIALRSGLGPFFLLHRWRGLFGALLARSGPGSSMQGTGTDNIEAYETVHSYHLP